MRERKWTRETGGKAAYHAATHEPSRASRAVRKRPERPVERRRERE